MIRLQEKNGNPYGFIYITTNLVNGRKYIGQRKYDSKGYYKYYFGSGTIIRSAIKKYGIGNFSKEIIDTASTQEELNFLEIKYIKKYNAVNDPMYYNIASGGKFANPYENKTEEEMNEIKQKMSQNHADFKGKNHPQWGVVMSEEQRRKISTTLIGRYLGKNSPNAKRVVLINTGEVFDTVSDAGKKFTIDVSSIVKCCKQKVISAGVLATTGEPMQWQYYEDYLSGQKICEYKNRRKKSVICIYTGEVFTSILEAGIKYNIDKGSISACCKGKLKSAGKHPTTGKQLQWQYYEEYLSGISINEYNNCRKKKVICLNTKEVFQSIEEACSKYSIHYNGIMRCCKGRQNYSGIDVDSGSSLQWQYYNDYLKNIPLQILENKQKRKVVCVTTNEEFESLKDASEKYLIRHCNIGNCCSKRQASAGKHPETGEPLVWMYYEDWLKQHPKT